MNAIASLAFESFDLRQIAGLFPGYDITGLVACGGMGAVYQAVQRSLARTVAIKILPREFGADPSFRQAFQLEAKVMARLNHPNLIGVFDAGEVDGMPYLIMEYVPGGSLHEATHGHCVQPHEAATFIASVCEGLAHAHAHGILHWDIKPANILLDAEARPKIGDFGLARPVGHYEDGPEIIFGTPHYTAPEVLNRPTAVDSRADIFSIGVVLHQLLTGRLPAEDPRMPSRICGCDIRFDHIVGTATHPLPEMRYSSADQMARELHHLAQELRHKLSASIGAAPRSAVPNRAPAPVRRAVGPTGYTTPKHRASEWLTTAALLCGAVAVGWFILKKGAKVEGAAAAGAVAAVSEEPAGPALATTGESDLTALAARLANAAPSHPGPENKSTAADRPLASIEPVSRPQEAGKQEQQAPASVLKENESSVFGSAVLSKKDTTGNDR
ncbi:serine/threonine protein kinase [Luteolibacter ambystomatis]|uniref:Serine/threonine protein kinase n=1 Tax=Luteolibacter ambystomatis TaxID=2824561 RepID=A0A975G7W6_9BACT|nr:serine/threonine-protein kinase [Luteolibacter ambystomatis]QUE50583.1 serine/threonine protein kinase [Luteolibacter ambystomatis]